VAPPHDLAASTGGGCLVRGRNSLTSPQPCDRIVMTEHFNEQDHLFVSPSAGEIRISCAATLICGASSIPNLIVKEMGTIRYTRNQDVPTHVFMRIRNKLCLIHIMRFPTTVLQECSERWRS
jgi:hypothetical protein